MGRGKYGREKQMENRINLIYARDKKDLCYFWERRNEYFSEDILPNREAGDALTKSDIDWFFSKEYKDHIMMLFKRKTDPLFIVLINEGNTNIGFIAYVIYNSEDGKCFILDYCIYPEYRNKGIGETAFHQLEKDFVEKGAAYIDLNISNRKNEKFWTSIGFAKTTIKDERNKYIYRKRL